jgi:hypothetical protein
MLKNKRSKKMMNFFKNFLQRLTTLVLGISIVALLFFNYVNTAQAGMLDDGHMGKVDSEGTLYKNTNEGSDLRGIKRGQMKLNEADHDQRASTDGQTLSRDRDMTAYEDDASLGEKFSDTIENAKETFQRATQAVGEENRDRT